MFNPSLVLEASQKVLKADTSSLAGTQNFISAIQKVFPDISWKALQAHKNQSVYYFETLPEKNSIDLLCYINIDTVNSSNLSLWDKTDYDPLAITLKKGQLFGLGAAHEKISIVPLLMGLEQASTSNLNIMIAAGYGRETKMQGAKRLILEALRKRPIHKVLVVHPTENQVHYGSSGRLKTKVFFPFSEEEKALRIEHDLKENISSQSKVFNFNGDLDLEGNSIFQLIKSCAHLPEGTVILDIDGGTSSINEPETAYFEIDFMKPFKGSLVSKFSSFGDLLLQLNQELCGMFEPFGLKRALHIGKCQDSEDGVTFYGFNLIPAKLSAKELDHWFSIFKSTALEAGGVVTILDAKSPYFHPDQQNQNMPYSTHLTEASLFSKICSNVIICGAGKEGSSKKPNESIKLDHLVESCEVFYNIFKNLEG